MKIKLCRLIFSAMKLSLVGMLLQCVFFNLLFASRGDAQVYKSVREVHLNIHLEDASVQEAFRPSKKTATLSSITTIGT